MLLKQGSFAAYKKRNVCKGIFADCEEQIIIVRKIIEQVRSDGDQAIRELTRCYDQTDIADIAVTEEEIGEALKKVDQDFLRSLRLAKKNIEKFHQRQLANSWWDSSPGIFIGQYCRPLESIGAYIPGGTAALSSSVLMTVVPAKIAGVKKVYLCSPPHKDGSICAETLVAAHETGVTGIFKVGGAQAIAGLAYGTETIPAVHKIVGPGNIYVTLAKREVFGQVGIDMLAGPSEIVVVADQHAKPEYIAADLLSQAEHDVRSRSILITNSEQLASSVQDKLAIMLHELPRKDIAKKSLQEKGAIIIVSSLDEAIAVVNEIAPEHVELHFEHPWEYIGQIMNAGAIFVGPYTPESLGDYYAGSNHVLPTSGSARYASALGVYDFIKWSNVISYSSEALEKAASHLEKLARAEGLEAHARAALVRRKNNDT